jgi:hypothetical protein
MGCDCNGLIARLFELNILSDLESSGSASDSYFVNILLQHLAGY